METQDLRKLPLSETGQEMDESGLSVSGPQSTQLGQEPNPEPLGLPDPHVTHVHVVPYGQHKLWWAEG